jgi:hypothetical protein
LLIVGDAGSSALAPLLKPENPMSAASLFRLADKVVMTAITAALIVAVPVSAVAFVAQTL